MSFKPTVSPLEVAIEFCDSVSVKYGLTPQNYHSNCVNPIQLFVAKEVKAYYRQRTKLMMARTVQQAEAARKVFESNLPDQFTDTKLSSTSDGASTPVQGNTAEEVQPKPTAPPELPQRAAPNTMTENRINIPDLSPTEQTEARPNPVIDAVYGTDPNTTDMDDRLAAKAKARAAVESAKQHQAAKAAAKVNPSVDKVKFPENSREGIVGESIPKPPITDNEKRLLREKEMADRIKYVDKRSQARLAALRAKAADREEREKIMSRSD